MIPLIKIKSIVIKVITVWFSVGSTVCLSEVDTLLVLSLTKQNVDGAANIFLLYKMNIQSKHMINILTLAETFERWGYSAVININSPRSQKCFNSCVTSCHSLCVSQRSGPTGFLLSSWYCMCALSAQSSEVGWLVRDKSDTARL